MMLVLTACDDASPPPSAPANEAVPAAKAAQTQPPAAARTSERASTYTKLSETACELIEENKEEGPYWLRRCPGPNGWKVEWGESDLRQGIVLISSSGKEADLELSDKVANGAFNILGPAIEWRGVRGRPADVVIVRMDVTDNANPERPPKSRLAVAGLTPVPCLVAIVEPGPGQNEKARAIADGKLPMCIGN
jgi:hypothetical protein